MNTLQNVSQENSEQIITETQIAIDKLQELHNKFGLNTELESFHGILGSGNAKICQTCDKNVKNAHKHIMTKSHLIKIYDFSCNLCDYTAKSYKARYNHEHSAKHKSRLNSLTIEEQTLYDRTFVRQDKPKFTSFVEKIQEYEDKITVLENKLEEVNKEKRLYEEKIMSYDMIFKQMFSVMDIIVAKTGDENAIYQMNALKHNLQINMTSDTKIIEQKIKQEKKLSKKQKKQDKPSIVYTEERKSEEIEIIESAPVQVEQDETLIVEDTPLNILKILRQNPKKHDLPYKTIFYTLECNESNNITSIIFENNTVFTFEEEKEFGDNMNVILCESEDQMEEEIINMYGSDLCKYGLAYVECEQGKNVAVDINKIKLCKGEPDMNSKLVNDILITKKKSLFANTYTFVQI